jgi:hypothetical protein
MRAALSTRSPFLLHPSRRSAELARLPRGTQPSPPRFNRPADSSRRVSRNLRSCAFLWRINFLSQKKRSLLLPSASDRAWVRAIAKDQRRRLDEERLAGFNQSADLSTHPRKISVRTTRATAPLGSWLSAVATSCGRVRTCIACRTAGRASSMDCKHHFRPSDDWSHLLRAGRPLCRQSADARYGD